jgi:integrase
VIRVREFLASFPFADSTKDAYSRVLSQLVTLPIVEMGAADLLQFVCRPEWGSNQRYTALAACRKFLAWSFGSGHPALAARVKRVRAKRQRVLSPSVALELLASFDAFTAIGARDLAIAAVALDTGLRCSELCRLRLADVDLSARTLQVIVKGGQWGMGVYSPETAQYVDRWLSFRVAAAGVETLFVSFQHGNLGGSLTREGLQGIVKRWGIRLGVRMSPHDFRRSFATLATINGAPSRIVQEAGRWANIDMVEYYTQGISPSLISPYLPVSRLVHI